jgi:putative membrane protein
MRGGGLFGDRDRESGSIKWMKEMKKIWLLGICLILSGPAFGQSIGEKTGVNSALGIAPTTQDFVNEGQAAICLRYSRASLPSSLGHKH